MTFLVMEEMVTDLIGDLNIRSFTASHSVKTGRSPCQLRRARQGKKKLILPKEGVDEFRFIEHLEIFDLFAHADISHRDFEFV